MLFAKIDRFLGRGETRFLTPALSQREREKSRGRLSAEEWRCPPSKILIVDDEPFNVDYLEQELEDLGYDTVSAGNGQEALEKVATEAPDLILLDIMMPIMDGFTVCRILKGNDDTRLLPIVIMTALDGIDDRIKGIEAGADDFLTKPVNQRELVARIQTALKLKHTVDRKISVNCVASKITSPGSCQRPSNASSPRTLRRRNWPNASAMSRSFSWTSAAIPA